MFFYIILISTVVFIMFAYLARGSTFDGVGSDAFKQVNAASHFSEWGGWPSGMHNFAGGKAWIKDVGVLLLVLMQRILKDKTGFYPVVMVSNFCHTLSGILLFLVVEYYWGGETGLALFFLYMFCFWPYMIVLHGGLQVVSQMFFLLSLFSLQQADVSFGATNLLWYFGAGVSFGLMNFSSASGRKFIPVFISALVYHSSGNHAFPWLVYKTEYTTNFGFYVFLGFALLILFIVGLVSLTYKKIILRIYDGRLSFYKFRSQGKNDITHYYNRAQKLVSKIQSMAGFIIPVLFLFILYLHEDESYLLLGCTCAGALFTATILMLPNFIENLRGYFGYWIIESDWGSHYPMYNDYFLKNYGQVFKKGKEGWIWYYKFFKRMIPFNFLLYVLSIVSIVWEFFANPIQGNTSILLLVLISIMPIIWGEITIGPKAFLPMYTSLIPLYIPLGYIFQESSLNNWNYLGYEFNLYIWIFLAISCAWNIYIFFLDTMPCRMTFKRIMNTLDRNSIKKFYTYDTPFNTSFLVFLNYFYPNKYDVEYISSIRELNKGFFLVPATGSKAADFQSFGEIGPVGDFKGDDFLNKLLETKDIHKCSVSSFKTLGNSKYWQQLGNLVSFRDLILNEINEEDKFRGYAWLLEAGKIKKYLTKQDN